MRLIVKMRRTASWLMHSQTEICLDFTFTFSLYSCILDTMHQEWLFVEKNPRTHPAPIFSLFFCLLQSTHSSHCLAKLPTHCNIFPNGVICCLKVHKHEIFFTFFRRNHMVPRACNTRFLKILFDSAEIFDF